jgi:uracil-DNA glycosylase
VKPSTLSSYVQEIRAEKHLTVEVPDFDPNNGNEKAKYLFILEAPGPKAVKSGYVTFDNPDLTASNLKVQLKAADVERNEIAIWNIVPWYVGNEDNSRIRAVEGTEVREGIAYLLRLLPLLPSLRCIVLVGGAARRAHVPLSAATTCHILSCHHPSPRAMNMLTSAVAENVAVFKNMQRVAA